MKKSYSPYIWLINWNINTERAKFIHKFLCSIAAVVFCSHCTYTLTRMEKEQYQMKPALNTFWRIWLVCIYVYLLSVHFKNLRAEHLFFSIIIIVFTGPSYLFLFTDTLVILEEPSEDEWRKNEGKMNEVSEGLQLDPRVNKRLFLKLPVA